LKQVFEARKADQQLQWELFGTEIGLGEAYTLALSPENKAKPMKLDGRHVKKLLANDTWRKGIAILDPRPETYAVWEVISKPEDI
jgi:hypothetical protein